MRPPARTWLLLLLGAGLAGGLVWVADRGEAPEEPEAVGPVAPPNAEAPPAPRPSASAAVTELPPEPRGLVLPTGSLPALTCDQARRVIAQARGALATQPDPVDPKRFAASTSDWLDPHGLWSVAPDAKPAKVLSQVGANLLGELETAPGAGPCAAAIEVGAALNGSLLELRGVVQRARDLGRIQSFDPHKRWEIASSTPFEDGTVTRPARELAQLLGHGIGGVERGFGPEMSAYADVAVDRLVPNKTAEEWSEVVLAAAVRAYMPQLDPHGAWAPLDEETSIYDLDLEVDPPPRLWSEMTRTTLGARVDAGAMPPLQDGDVVLEIAGVAVSGLGVEQCNQLAVMTDPEPVSVKVLRAGASAPLALAVAAEPAPPHSPDAPAAGLSAKEVAFGKGAALVVKIPDVPDDLGDAVAEVVLGRSEEPIGVLLDLRGNGGGSTDGALGALGLFLPGAALFPMKRRDGAIEIDRAPRLPVDQVWTGPVAVLVDGDTASAAEMIAGAIAAYERGPVLGARTYGKGCAQEYLDDETGVGVLRVTTLVFCLPDGSPLQRVGVTPNVALGLPSALERESNLKHAPNTWRGPDVRDKSLVRPVPWPENGGHIGVADDESIYRALRALGAARQAAR